MTQRIELELIYTLGEMAGLPVGTRIATNDNKLLTLEDSFLHQRHWFEEGELTHYSPIHEWLPVIVLPPKVNHGEEDD